MVRMLALVFSTVAFAQMALGMQRPTAPPGVPAVQPQSPDASAAAQEQENQPGWTGATHSDVVYGKVERDKLRLDIYEPKERHDAASSAEPAVILIHGGGWSEGDKSDLARMARWLQKNNYVVFNINYRLWDGKHNPWPAQLDDAQTAVRWVRANAKKYNADPAHIGAWGYSAGGQMAALLGEVETRDNSDAELAGYSSRVQAVVDVAGPVDMTADASARADKDLIKFLGGTLEQNPQAWHNAAPALLVNKDTAPFLIVHGTKDELVPIAQSEELAAALDRAGVAEELIKVDEGHFMTGDASKKRLAAETVAFFNRTLR